MAMGVLLLRKIQRAYSVLHDNDRKRAVCREDDGSRTRRREGRPVWA